MNVSPLRVDANFGETAIHVGTLAENQGTIYFEYADEALDANLHFSPFELPLKSGLSTGPSTPFEGLQGLFADSLPDGWGRMLLDRQWRSQGMRGLPSPLTRLASVGQHAVGA